MVLTLTFLSQGRRVALTPDAVGKLHKKWPDMAIRFAAGAGLGAGYPDETYAAAGATPVGKAGQKGGTKATAKSADICLSIAPPAHDVDLGDDGVLVCQTSGPESWKKLAKIAPNVLALEKLPRTSRAQALDVLSSQANLAGYAAVLAAAGYLPRLMPQLMTAAGASKPANVLVLGVGVAGLQAIATAKRLGAVVHAFDVRPEVAEQIRSLGAKVVSVEGAAAGGQGGYAGAMDASGMKVLQEKLLPFVAAADVVVSTAQVPGRAAPVLVSAAAVEAMRPGSVVVDLGAGGFNKANGIAGGNCPLTVADETATSKNGVTLVGETSWPERLAGDASRFWGQNMVNLLGLLINREGKVDFTDELVAAMRVVANGKVTG